MLNSRSTNIKIIKWSLIFLLFLIIASFAFFRSLNYLEGPYVEINYPKNGEIITAKTIEITGIAKRINKIYINDFSINIDEQGNWNETLIIFPGLNKITIKVQDKFGRTLQKQLDIVGQINQ